MTAARPDPGHRRAAADRQPLRARLDTLRALPRRPFQVREFIQQTWFVASVTILPTALVSIPFGAVIALQLGIADPPARRAVLHRRGVACSRSSARPARSSRRCSSPAPAAPRSAPTSAPARSATRSTRWRCWASARSSAWSCRACWPRMLVALLLNGLVSVVGVVGGYFFNVDPAGRHAGRLPRLLHRAGPDPRPLVRRDQGADLRLHRRRRRLLQGLTAGGGPKGVGDAVNQSVVITFLLLFVVNFVITAIYFQLVPQKRVMAMTRSRPRSLDTARKPRRGPGRPRRPARLLRPLAGLDPAHAAPLQEGDPAAAGRGQPSAPARWPSSAARSASSPS